MHAGTVPIRLFFQISSYSFLSLVIVAVILNW